jgi:hypothetical protein
MKDIHHFPVSPPSVTLHFVLRQTSHLSYRDIHLLKTCSNESGIQAVLLRAEDGAIKAITAGQNGFLSADVRPGAHGMWSV